MMERGESRTDLGAIKIHKNVIASISQLAAVEIDGVKRVGTNSKSMVIEFIGKKLGAAAIKVGIDKNEEVKIEIPVIIKYDYNIPEVSNRIQENVRTALEKMTSISIKDININVQGIEK